MFSLIMAGGTGTRFWPKSRRTRPKQLLNVYGEKTLIQGTVDRLKPLVAPERTFIVSTADQHKEIKKQLTTIPHENYIVEPIGKNTAPCIALSALFMERIDPEGVMIVLPADHHIANEAVFHQTLRVGARVASESGSLVTIGIEPKYPATGYGYIQVNEELATIDDVRLLEVKTFAEKPNLATAKRFLKSGDFLWNSGIFIWKFKTILGEIEKNLPELYDGLIEIRSALDTSAQEETINRVYRQIKNISIDYGVMEHASDVKVLNGKFDWNDLGTWEEIYNLHEKDSSGNVLIGNHITKDSTGCFIDAPDKCVAVIGLEDLIIVETDDALLICPRSRSQEVKDIVDIAKRKKMLNYL